MHIIIVKIWYEVFTESVYEFYKYYTVYSAEN